MAVPIQVIVGSVFVLFIEFNVVTRTCIQDLVPAILRHLNLPKSKRKEPVLPSCSPRWKKIRLHVKAYVVDVIEVLSCVLSVVNIILVIDLNTVASVATYKPLTVCYVDAVCNSIALHYV